MTHVVPPNYFEGDWKRATVSINATGVTAALWTDRALGHYSIQVKGTGGIPTDWSISVEGSLDGTNFVATGLAHGTTDGDGGVVWLTTAGYCSIRLNCVALTLGGASALSVTVVGKP